LSKENKKYIQITIEIMSRIVMANIKMPILVKNGTLQPLSEYIKIQIEQCSELPEKNNDTDGSIMEKINRILEEQDNEKADLRLTVTNDELLESKPKKHRKNLSFKNTSKTMSRYTMKNYISTSTSNTSDVDHSLLQEVLESL